MSFPCHDAHSIENMSTTRKSARQVSFLAAQQPSRILCIANLYRTFLIHGIHSFLTHFTTADGPLEVLSRSGLGNPPETLRIIKLSDPGKHAGSRASCRVALCRVALCRVVSQCVPCVEESTYDEDVKEKRVKERIHDRSVSDYSAFVSRASMSSGIERSHTPSIKCKSLNSGWESFASQTTS